MKAIIEQALEAKLREHAELVSKESELSLQIGFFTNDQWRTKRQGDRKLTSQRIAQVLREIEGLASILTENKHESQPA